MVILIILSQIILLPIMGAMVYRIRWERQRKEQLLDEATEHLQLVSISRGRRRW